jgi:hypothetical protein
MLSYYGLKFQVNRTSGRHHNTGMNFVIYFHLTSGLPIWLGLFSYKDVAAGFGNFLVPQVNLTYRRVTGFVASFYSFH